MENLRVRSATVSAKPGWSCHLAREATAMDASENQPPAKKGRRRTAYVLHLQQKERAALLGRIRSIALGCLVLAGLGGFIYFMLSVTSGSTKPVSRPTPPPWSSGR